MQILAIEHELPGIPADAFTPDLLREEAAHAWDLHQRGIIRELYFREDAQSAVLILECDSKQAAEDILNGLPLVKAGLIRFDVIPLRAYDGFARLFAPKAAS